MATENMESNKKVRIVSPLSYLDDVVISTERMRVRAQVRLSHLAKQGREDRVTEAILNDFQKLEEKYTQELKKEMEQHPAWPWLSQVRGAGPENSAKVIGIIEGTTFKSTGRWGIAAFDTMSRLRRFAGHAPMDGKTEKRTKGEKLHYSSELRTMLWRLGESLIRADGAFYRYYIDKKNEYIDRFTRDGYKILPTPKGGYRCSNCDAHFKLKRDVHDCCDSPLPEKVLKKEPPGVIFLGHLDAMARRKMRVMFLDMLWIYWREALGLPAQRSYIAGCKPIRQHRPEDFIG